MDYTGSTKKWLCLSTTSLLVVFGIDSYDACAKNNMVHKQAKKMVGVLPSSSGKAVTARRPSSAKQRKTVRRLANPEMLDIAVKRIKHDGKDTPASTTYVSQKELRERNVTNTAELGRVAAGVMISQMGQASTSTVITIRGVANLDFSDHQESPNTVYSDGAYISFPGAIGGSMFDLDRVEIERGPQGTMGGRNTTGGSIKLVTAKPTEKLSAYAQASYGSYSSFQEEAAVGGGITSTLMGRLSFQTSRQNGYIHNTLGGDFGNVRDYNARLQFLWRPSSHFENLINFHGSYVPNVTSGIYAVTPTYSDPTNAGLSTPANEHQFQTSCASSGFGQPPLGSLTCYGGKKPKGYPYTVSSSTPGFFQRQIYGATNTATWRTNHFVVRSISDVLAMKKRYQEDTDGTELSILNYNTKANTWQASQELNISGKEGRWTWLAGLYYLHINGDYRQGMFGGYPASWSTDTFYRQTVNTGAVFAQSDYRITPTLTATIGARFTVDSKSIHSLAYCSMTPALCAAGPHSAPTGYRIGGNFQNEDWSGKVGLTWKPTSNVMTYGTITRGTRGVLLEAQTAIAPNAQFRNIVVKPEDLWDFETGIKTNWFDHKLEMDVGAFYYNYHNYQAYRLDVLSEALFNAEAYSYGGELSLTAHPIKNLSVSVGASMMHGYVKNVSMPDGQLRDQNMAFAPHWMVNSSVRYEVPVSFGGLFVQGDMSYVDSRYASTVNSPALAMPAYVLANASTGWYSKNRRWNVTFFVKNLANAFYYTDNVDITGADGTATPSFSTPRWFSGQVRYEF
ncbi:TonB-dependent receptor [Acetobacter persici]|uniref:TonB-dependent receptor n=1 Tax=Acetobacter persici TaxID=1076596 RepID=A0A6V8I9R0_9PROT|nr:TonB-dependent receptor [Acetobacter persici]GFE93807.1 TonB-dependent receptor [Acetobacter persici]